MPDKKISELDPVTDVQATDDFVLARSGETNRITGANLEAAFGGGDGSQSAYIRDEKSSGTNGGTFTNGAWRTRDLNTEVFDPDGIVTISSNQFTLAAGDYEIYASAPAAAVNGHQCRLQNITDATTVENGTSEVSGAGDFVVTRSIVRARFTIAGSKAFEIQHQCQTTGGSSGTFGANVGFTVASEVYTEVYITKLA